jgi:hypothetical protein
MTPTSHQDMDCIQFAHFVPSLELHLEVLRP